MKALRTQFDESGFSGAVATPTCSSSCCCCCCLAAAASTAVVGNAMIKNSQSKQPAKKRRPTKNSVSMPYLIALVIALGYLGALLFDLLFGSFLAGELVLRPLAVFLAGIMSMLLSSIFIYWYKFGRAAVSKPGQKLIILLAVFIGISLVEVAVGFMLFSSPVLYILVVILAVIVTSSITDRFLGPKTR